MNLHNGAFTFKYLSELASVCVSTILSAKSEDFFNVL